MKKLFKNFEKIYYWPNNGNLGDLLIAEATRQYFRRNNISWEEYNPDNPPHSQNFILIYGGGGRFTSHWYEGLDLILSHLTHPRVKVGIILPHSFFDVDFFVRALDERHTIICREKQSYDYCSSLSSKSKIMLDDDMGLHLNLNELPSIKEIPELHSITNKEEYYQYQLLQNGWREQVINGVYKSTISARINGVKKKVAFLLRTDKEKTTILKSSLSYDISSAWNASCRNTAFNAYFIRVFAEALTYPDVIVTDRLHVGIMAHHCGKEIYFLDNDYGKIQNVYQQSLNKQPNIHLLNCNILDEKLKTAWNRLQIKSCLFRALAFPLKTLLRIKRIFQSPPHVL